MFTYLLTMRLARTKRGTGLYVVDDELNNSVYVYNKDIFLDFYISCVLVVVSCHICITLVNMLPLFFLLFFFLFFVT